MRHGNSNNRRQRNRGGNGRRGGQQRMQVFDSNGPDVRIRGTAYQVTEKYMALAKDAAAAGDEIMAQNYLQHAEHYQRVINSWEEKGGVRPASEEPAEAKSDEKIAPKEQEAETSQKKPQSNDDLGLPGSILGDPVPTESKELAES